MKTLAQFLLVFAIGMLGITLAIVAAPVESELASANASLKANEDYQKAILSLCVTFLLLVPAYWAFLLQYRNGPSTLWRSCWTVAWLAFTVHWYWAIQVVMAMAENGAPVPPERASAEGIPWTLPSIIAHIYDQKHLLSPPTFHIAVFLWWAIDVGLSWIPKVSGLGIERAVAFGASRRNDVEPAAGHPLVRFQRSALHAVLAVGLLIDAVLLGPGPLRPLAVLLFFSMLIAVAVRIVRRPFYPESLSGRLLTTGFRTVNRFFLWYEMPTWLAVINLAAIREHLRAQNLHGTEKIPVTNPEGVAPAQCPSPTDLFSRRRDGWFNDLDQPAMGSGSETRDPSGDSMIHDRSNCYARFGRNVPLEKAHADIANLFVPSPRLVSEALLARKETIEAPSLNLIAAAWIQFQTHDWFNHGEPVRAGAFKVPLPAGDTWQDPESGKQEMVVRATRPDPTRPDTVNADGQPRTFVNSESHWWDASQIYGSSPVQELSLRRNSDGELLPGGKLYLDESNQLPFDLGSPNGIALSGFVGNWWAGLSLLHDLFVKEHNSICDMLQQANPAWESQRIYSTAKMINGALMAKIHTVEWTPALLQHPALQIGMKANWWGLATEGITRTLGRIGPTEAFGGIPNSGVDHHGTPFTLTEEFVAVYRLHPLLPDVIRVRRIDDPAFFEECDTGTEAAGTERELRQRILRHGRENVWYSFGLQSPGALTLHNYPNFLRRLSRETAGVTLDEATGTREVIKETIDLATIDILRDRERGVPRYNEFRRMFHMRPIASFDDFSANPYHPGLPQQLRDVYGQTNGADNVHLLDLMVGMFAEIPPPGFAISDTAFRVFILMASRRLKSDRFIADGFSEEVFTRQGVDWVNDNSMVSILIRHFPNLSGPLYGVGNAFVPWRPNARLTGAS